jgi:hypothetical protein
VEADNEPIIVETLEDAAFLLEDDPTIPVLIDPGYFARLRAWVAPELLESVPL